MYKTKPILDILDSTRGITEFNQVMGIILKKIKKYSGFESVGIRIENKVNDYPYYVYEGFSKNFIMTENQLCRLDKAGNVIIDSTGKSDLECMCGNVIRKHYDPKASFFTKNGSFWTNSTTDLLATTSEKDRKGKTRNKCNTEGYESVGLFPLDTGHKNLGLLQLNDKKKDMFSDKSVKEFELLARYIAGVVNNANIIRGLKDAEERLKILVQQDELTGCMNFRFIMRHLENEIMRSKRHNREFSVIMIDIDHFKRINDKYGHLAGNDVLVAFANAIKGAVRSIDTVGRYGGEEFLIVLPESNSQQALVALRRMRDSLSQVKIHSVYLDDKKKIALKFSAGIADFPHNAKDLKGLIGAADNSLLRAKREGRNRSILEMRKEIRFQPLPSSKVVALNSSE